MVPGRWMLGKRATAGYAVVAAAVMATGIAGFVLLREARQAGNLVRATQRALDAIAAVEIDLLNAETGQRGYLLTGDPTYLEPFAQGDAAVQHDVQQLARRVAGSPPQRLRMQEIAAVVHTRLGELRETIDKRRTDGLEAALVIVRTNRGKHTMDRLRTLLRAAREEEAERLNVLLAARPGRFWWASRVVVGGSTLALVAVVLSTLLANRNVRGRRKAEWQARESEERLRVTLRSIGDAVIATDVSGRVVFMNAVAEGLTGWPEPLARGQPLDQVFRIITEETRATVENPVTKVLREGAIVGLANHTVLLSRTGRETPVDDSGAPIRDAGGEIMGVVLVFRDTSERKQAEVERERLALEEAARREAERVSHAKDEFLAVLSHELRSPLQGILGWLTVLRDRRSDDTQRQRAQQAIERGVRQQAQLVNDLLDASRIIAGKFQIERTAIEMGAVVRECVDEILPLTREKGVDVTVDVDTCGTALGDPQRLRQSVSNVLANAVRFTPAGGRIAVRCHREKDDVVITVRDTGEGIAPEFLPYLFDRFSQAAADRVQPVSGLGLGLSIARQIVELHGGTITAESEGSGRGATFTLRLPMAAGAVTRAHAQPTHDKPSTLQGLSLLVVDDDAETRESLALLLALRGASVRNAGSVAEALALYAAQPVRVVISDLSMPERDGYDLVEALRRDSANHGLVAIALTGFAMESDRTRAINAGFDAHLSKPVDIDALIGTIRALVKASPAP